MSATKDMYEGLVEQTVHKMLFCEVAWAAPSEPFAVKGSHNQMSDTVDGRTTQEVQKDLLLDMLINLDPEDGENNNAYEARRSSWVVECSNWSIDRLRREKAAIKHYIKLLQERVGDGEASKLTDDALIIHEAYALLKLFLLERDPDYRQCLQQSDSYLTSLQVQLNLYAKYFERANGRQISEKPDVKPIATLYDFFVTHHRSSNQQQTE